MNTIKYELQSGSPFTSKPFLVWRIIQGLFWLIGFSILFCLFFFPDLGITMFWNILIPIAPVLLVISVGFWRNICPLSSSSLLPRHLNVSKRKKITLATTGKLNLIGLIALLILIPLRHALFDKNGLATGILIISLTSIAVISGFFFEWKSAWCSGLCPVFPVEKLYGLKNKIVLPNSHCSACNSCVIPCPDSTPKINPLSLKNIKSQKISGILMVGGFPGFIWGWFQVPDFDGITGIDQLLSIYYSPILGLMVTTSIFIFLKKFIKEKLLISIFSASAVYCYYWFRIPELFGFGVFKNDGLLLDCANTIPEWLITGIVLTSTLFFFWWIVFSKQTKLSWMRRPAYEKK